MLKVFSVRIPAKLFSYHRRYGGQSTVRYYSSRAAAKSRDLTQVALQLVQRGAASEPSVVRKSFSSSTRNEKHGLFWSDPVRSSLICKISCLEGPSNESSETTKVEPLSPSETTNGEPHAGSEITNEEPHSSSKPEQVTLPENAVENSPDANPVPVSNDVQCPNAEDKDIESKENDTATAKTQEPVVVDKFIIDVSNLFDYVGKPNFENEKIYEQLPIGVTLGLAWDIMGGCPLYMEVVLEAQGQGKRGLHLTGQLGDVMTESAEIAHTVAKNILFQKEPNNTFFADSKLHLHVPEGAAKKDGPSAGCAIATSMLSLAINKPVKKDLAMTGEITLTGMVRSIGGVREKTVTAKRVGAKTIILPSGNRRDFEELGEKIKEGLEVHFVDNYNQVYDIAFSADDNLDHSVQENPSSEIHNSSNSNLDS